MIESYARSMLEAPSSTANSQTKEDKPDVHDITHQEPYGGQRPIISLNGRSLAHEERTVRDVQANGVLLGHRGRTNTVSDDERQDAGSEDEKFPTRRGDGGLSSRPRMNGVIPNGLLPNNNSNRRASVTEPDN